MNPSFNLSEWAINNRALVSFMMIVIIVDSNFHVFFALPRSP